MTTRQHMGNTLNTEGVKLWTVFIIIIITITYTTLFSAFPLLAKKTALFLSECVKSYVVDLL